MLGQCGRYNLVLSNYSSKSIFGFYLLLVEDVKCSVLHSFVFFDRLLEEFENHIEELKLLDEKIQRRVEKLEHQCHREAKEFAHKVQDLQRSNQVH